MTGQQRYSTIEERIGRIQGTIEPLPRDIAEIYGRLNGVEKDLVQIKSDVRAVSDTTARNHGALESRLNTTAVFDPEECERCLDLLQTQESKATTQEALVRELQEDLKARREALKGGKAVVTYILDKAIALALTLLAAYLLLRFGLQQ